MLQDLKDRLTQHGLVSERHHDNEVRFSVDADIAEEIVSSGTGASAGTDDHHHFLPDVQRILTRYGARVDIVQQSDRDDADFLVEYLEMDQISATGDAHEDALVDFRDSHPVLGALSPHQTRIIGELESSTGRTKPAQTIANLATAVEQGHDTLFAVPDGGDEGFDRYAKTVWNTLTSPPMVSREKSDRTYLYMHNLFTTADGERIWRPDTDSQTRWWIDHETDEVVLGDTDDNEFGRFNKRELSNGPSRSSLGNTDPRALFRDSRQRSPSAQSQIRRYQTGSSENRDLPRTFNVRGAWPRDTCRRPHVCCGRIRAAKATGIVSVPLSPTSTVVQEVLPAFDAHREVTRVPHPDDREKPSVTLDRWHSLSGDATTAWERLDRPAEVV